MNLVAALTTVALSFTYPSINATQSCVPLPDYPLDDLSAVEVHFMPRYEYRDRVVYSAPADGMAGQHVTVEVTVDSEGVLWVETVDAAGNHSCDSNLIVVAYTTDTPPTEGAPSSATVWYDVAGRRYRREPTAPGVYVRVQGNERRKVVKLR